MRGCSGPGTPLDCPATVPVEGRAAIPLSKKGWQSI